MGSSFRVLITGGAGFIGSHVVEHFVKSYPDYQIFNLDKLTYAGHLDNLLAVENASNYSFIQGDITDESSMEELFLKHRFTHVIHLAAESHVDRSILSPLEFVKTNVLGTVNLLECAKKIGSTFYHISTDEVYGSLGPIGLFKETTAYDPRSPYSASKASSDHFVRAYGETYGLPVLLSNCSNNFGPRQYPEKLIPLAIKNFSEGKPVPVYGSGSNIRDWLYVEDHVQAIDLIFHRGAIGETYNVGGRCELKNIDLIRHLASLMDDKLGKKKGESEKLITFVKDRPGHDQRYAIDCSKIEEELGWKSQFSFEEALDKTVNWYLTKDISFV